MSGVRWSALLAAAIGLAVGFWALERAGLDSVLAAVSRMGLAGFLLYVVSYGFTLVALGGAWVWSLREPPRPFALFTWARIVREGANELLPFSQLGGLVIGTRVLIDAGIAPVRTYAATLIDLTTEMVAQLVLTVLALGLAATIVTSAAGNGELDRLVWAGAAALGALAAGMLLLQRPFLRLAATLSARFLPKVSDMIGATNAELTRFSERRTAMLPSFLWNGAGWLLSILSAWIGLRLLGADISPARTLVIEMLIFALRSGAFLVPGAIGVQEAGYLLLGPLLGLDPQLALALSLVKRGRDIVIGVPALLVWQWRSVLARTA